MKFSLIHPSYGRPEMARQAYREWMGHFSREHQVEYILSLDKRDDTAAYKARLQGLVNIVVSDNQNVVQATNIAAKSATGDVLIYVSDDFGCPRNWDRKVAELQPLSRPAILEVDDCYQKNRNLLTIPIMNRELYTKLGYMWHPNYRSMFVDNDLYETCLRLGAIVDGRTLKFPHRHYSKGFTKVDATYLQSQQHWQQGKQQFNSRSQQQGWGIKY